LVSEVRSGDGFLPFISGKATNISPTASGALPDLIEKSCDEIFVVDVLLDPPLPPPPPMII